MVPSTPLDKEAATHQRAQWQEYLPMHIQEPGARFAPVMSKKSGATSVVGWWPMLIAGGWPEQTAWTAPCAVLFDATAAESEEALHHAWRMWLHAFNALQFMPGTWLVEREGLLAHDYDVLSASSKSAQPAQGETQAALNGIWQAVVEQVMEPMASGMKALAHAGVSPPEVGLELADSKGRAVADCELAWSDSQLAILRADQEDLQEHWVADGWKCLVLDEDLVTTQGKPWAVVAAEYLGIEVKLDEGVAA